MARVSWNSRVFDGDAFVMTDGLTREGCMFEYDVVIYRTEFRNGEPVDETFRSPVDGYRTRYPFCDDEFWFSDRWQRLD